MTQISSLNRFNSNVENWYGISCYYKWNWIHSILYRCNINEVSGVHIIVTCICHVNSRNNWVFIFNLCIFLVQMMQCEGVFIQENNQNQCERILAPKKDFSTEVIPVQIPPPPPPPPPPFWFNPLQWMCINWCLIFVADGAVWNNLYEKTWKHHIIAAANHIILFDFFYLQTYHEEMLQRSPRRKLFNDYAKQLMRRYPSMKEEISVRLGHLNQQWELLQSAISPQHGYLDEEMMLKGKEMFLCRICTSQVLILSAVFI